MQDTFSATGNTVPEEEEDVLWLAGWMLWIAWIARLNIPPEGNKYGSG
jgi:hypothetical protein